jgi:hypothetical protein
LRIGEPKVPDLVWVSTEAGVDRYAVVRPFPFVLLHDKVKEARRFGLCYTVRITSKPLHLQWAAPGKK